MKIVPLARLYCSQLEDFVNWSNESPGKKTRENKITPLGEKG
jgi:hypothetical protein